MPNTQPKSQPSKSNFSKHIGPSPSSGIYLPKKMQGNIITLHQPLQSHNLQLLIKDESCYIMY